jgi:hypothetical protein
VTRERPILFSGPMVRALLAGAKTQTRRIVKDPPRHWSEWLDVDGLWHPTGYTEIGPSSRGLFIWATLLNDGRVVPPRPSPYGVPGDRLWVKETFDAPPGSDRIAEVAYRADCVRAGDGGPWRPSIYMPRWASRITLEVTAVRAERLRSISEDDALAEGTLGIIDPELPPSFRHGAVKAFSVLWDSINYKTAPWASDPWVWVVGFRVLR